MPESDGGVCPFCPGNEAMTPPEVLSRRENGEWALRGGPNRYPALRTEIQLVREGLGVFDGMAGGGAAGGGVGARGPPPPPPGPTLAPVSKGVRGRAERG